MPVVPINFVAVFVATLVSMVVGFLWYGPLFGKQWMVLMKFNEADRKKGKEAGMTKNYVLMMLGSFVMAYVLAHSIVFGSAYLGVSGPMAGASAAFWSWLGFMAPLTMSSVLWEGKPWKLWLLNNGYNLVSLVLMGMVIASWK